MEHYTRLNELGRGTLPCDGHATREQWIEMLIQCKDELGCLFYF